MKVKWMCFYPQLTHHGLREFPGRVKLIWLRVFFDQQLDHHDCWSRFCYPLVMTNSLPWYIIDGPNRNRWFTNKKWWIFPVRKLWMSHPDGKLTRHPLCHVLQLCERLLGLEGRRYRNSKDPPFSIGKPLGKPSISIRGHRKTMANC